jgi:hypothetical protein
MHVKIAASGKRRYVQLVESYRDDAGRVKKRIGKSKSKSNIRPSQERSPHGSLLAARCDGDALHAVLCAAGYNLRWLLRAMARMGLKAILLRPILLALIYFIGLLAPHPPGSGWQLAFQGP